jgi:rhodanese-related sulfurtransferase
VKEISPKELSALLSDGARTPVVLDVRQPEEFERGHLAGSLLLPLMELPQRLSEFVSACGGRDREVVVVCRVGQRSARAAEWLIAQGFSDVANLVGGLNAYSAEVDPTLPQY